MKISSTIEIYGLRIKANYCDVVSILTKYHLLEYLSTQSFEFKRHLPEILNDQININ